LTGIVVLGFINRGEHARRREATLWRSRGAHREVSSFDIVWF